MFGENGYPGTNNIYLNAPLVDDRPDIGSIIAGLFCHTNTVRATSGGMCA